MASPPQDAATSQSNRRNGTKWRRSSTLSSTISAIGSLGRSTLPAPGAWLRFGRVEGFAEPLEERRYLHLNAVAPNYFETLGARCGRDASSLPGTQAAPLAIVNQATSRYYLPNRSPAPVLFGWLRVVAYLCLDAVCDTLRFMASCAPPGDSLRLFDSTRSPAPRQRQRFDTIAGRAAAAGEPWRTFFEPLELDARLRRSASAIDHIDADLLNSLYFSSRTGRPAHRRRGPIRQPCARPHAFTLTPRAKRAAPRTP